MKKVEKGFEQNGAVITSMRKSKAIVPEVVDGGTYFELVVAIGSLHERAKEKIAATANTTQVDTYWRTGHYIVEYEQHGADRAKYGTKLLSHLTRDLTLRYGKGYGKSNLVYMRKLYRAFPKGMTVSYQLSWSHYLEILKCSGIVLGTKKDDLVVQFATEGIPNRIFVSRYQLYLPDREQLRRELAIAIETEERSIVRRRKGKVAKR